MIRMPSLAHIRPNCVTATSPRSSCCAVGSFTYTFFQSVYSALGMPYLLTHLRNTATAAQVVSCSLNSASARLVASSTMFIRKHFDPRSSNQACWLPSNCTSSPKCCFLSRRFRCVLGLRSRLHKLASSIQRRNVSGCTFNPSSLFKCSAAKVGPNRLPTSPLYFSRISANARSRTSFGLLRLDGRPALQCPMPLPRFKLLPLWFRRHKGYLLATRNGRNSRPDTWPPTADTVGRFVPSLITGSLLFICSLQPVVYTRTEITPGTCRF